MLHVALNGTDKNPYEAMGVSQNPFPQIARAEVQEYVLHLQALGGDPILDVAHIRRHLRGWSDEFVNLCCERFERGKYVEFTVTFPEA